MNTPANKIKPFSKKTFVILCDGNFPAKGPALQLLKKAQKSKSHTLIACDGAILNLLKNNMDADHIVGDMDTLPKKYQKALKDKIHKEEEQDFNDQTKAFRFALDLLEKDIAEQKTHSENNLAEQKPFKTLSFVRDKTHCISSPSVKDSANGFEYNIVILGATGKREDHSLGNISYLPDYLEAARKRFPETAISISMITDFGVFVPVLNTTRLKGEAGDRVSIFAFDHSLRIKSQGLEYKTDDVVFDMWWKATLNRFKKRDALLEFSHPAKVILYFPY